jgi:hypothetical protein
VGQKAKLAGEAVGLTGPEAERNSFQNKNKFFKFTRILEICTRRFRRNFDTRIFPKFFQASQGFLENTICHDMNATLSQIKLRKSFC